MGHTNAEPNFLGLHRSSQVGSFTEQNFNSHAITPFHVEGMQAGLGSSGPISLIGNTRRVGHNDDLSIVMGPNGLCRVCEYVASGSRCPQCRVCNRVSTSRLLYAVWDGRRSVSSLRGRKKPTN